ncbi:squalene/phytoene synthase family protein [Zavarzinia sp. CC-PAN008]|uniref:squalene/phytoene synthase family protein n=1 Tax=Zavarzinia sp. CC-PAN008 TaxID=3243332 RepID=UPI003F748A25
MAAQVQEGDRERWLSALFAPEPLRPRLMALYAFNLELARIPEQVSQPMLGEIRFQWWREALAEAAQGRVRRHPVVEALASLQAQGLVDDDAAERIIAARARDLYPDEVADAAAVADLARATGGALTLWAARLLHPAADAEAAEAAGTAYALAGLVRRLPHDLAADRRQFAGGANLVPTARDLAARAEAALATARGRRRHVPRATMPAMLVASLAALHLKRIARAGFDPAALPPLPPLAPSLRLLRASLTRRW